MEKNTDMQNREGDGAAMCIQDKAMRGRAAHASDPLGWKWRSVPGYLWPGTVWSLRIQCLSPQDTVWRGQLLSGTAPSSSSLLQRPR